MKIKIQDVSSAISVSFLTVAAGAAFGVWTGVGALIGILSYGIASIVDSFFGGMKVKASGPIGPTAALFVGMLTVFGENRGALMISCILGAVWLFLAGQFKMGNFLKYVPNVVVSAFINGVAALIIWKQIKKLFPSEKTLSEALLSPEIWIALGTLGFLFLWLPIFKKLKGKSSWFGMFSGSLMSMILGGVVVFLFKIQTKTLNVELAGLFELIPDITLQNIPWGLVVFQSLNMAFLILLVTLITLRALSPKQDGNRELKNQSIVNIAIGFIGGIPSSVGFIRTKLLQLGQAQSQFVGMLVGILVFIEVFFFSNILAFVPIAVFIGVLMKAGLKAVDGGGIWHLYRNGLLVKESIIYIMIFALVFSGQLTIGILGGTAAWILCNRIWSFKDAKKCPCVD